MPELDYAVLCDFVRVDRGLAHVVAAGIDTAYAQQVPTGRNVGLLMRLTFTRAECGRPHRVEILFQDTDGQELVKVDGTITPDWVEGLPPGWPTGALFGMNLALPIPAYGVYSMEIMVNDTHKKSLNFRAEPPAEA